MTESQWELVKDYLPHPDPRYYESRNVQDHPLSSSDKLNIVVLVTMINSFNHQCHRCLNFDCNRRDPKAKRPKKFKKEKSKKRNK